jgi:thiol-disulfide isomerase/thioredoxin
MKLGWKNIALGVAVLLLVGALFYISTKPPTESFQNPTMPTFTMYYADWCGHCKTAKPEFESLVAKSPMDINGVKCNVRMVSPEKQPELAKGKSIKGFPTFLMETPDGKSVEYKGPRSTDGYLKFINETLGGSVGDVSGDTEAST